MNDCLFLFLGACKGQCRQCPFGYISGNSIEGGKILNKYEENHALRKKCIEEAKKLLRKKEAKK
jgi:hypothetical protein